nr:hypothetical protein [Tanacetum cinerariifolium]
MVQVNPHINDETLVKAREEKTAQWFKEHIISIDGNEHYGLDPNGCTKFTKYNGSSLSFAHYMDPHLANRRIDRKWRLSLYRMMVIDGDNIRDFESWPSLHDKLLAAALKAVLNNFQNQKKKQVETLCNYVLFATRGGSYPFLDPLESITHDQEDVELDIGSTR